MNKKIITGVIAVVIIVGVFYAGMTYGKKQSSTIAQNFRTGNFTGGQGTGTRGGTRAGGGIVSGDIITKDATGVTVKLQDGGSKIVLLSNSTMFLKTVKGTLTDLSVGTQITVIGATNSDGSVTAQSVQIRLATTTKP